jgi:hypothetical protein
VRIDEDFSADPRLIPGAVRRSHLEVQDWASRLMGQSVVVVCHRGRKLSGGTAALLQLARQIREITPGFPVVYVTSASAGDWKSQGVLGSVLIGKLFASAQLATVVSQLLDTGSSRG